MITATDVLNNKNGSLIYGTAPAAIPFQGGTLCVQTPFGRTPVTHSFGNAGPDDCSGALAIDFNALLQANPASAVACSSVYCQWFYRDPASATGYGFSDALQFVPQP